MAKVTRMNPMLESILKDCSKDNWDKENWDGDSAVAVEQKTCEYADRLINAMPSGIPEPSIMPERDGQVELEWYKGKTNLVSVSVNPEGRLSFIRVDGTDMESGIVQFDQEFPKQILDMIKGVFA